MITPLNVDRYGSLDIAFNNANFEGNYFPIAQQSEGLVAQSINFNFNATWMCIKHEIRPIVLLSLDTYYL